MFAGLGAIPAWANLIYINSSQINFGGVLSSVANARFRPNGNNWDQSVERGDVPVSALTIVTLNITNNNNAWVNTPFAFTLEHVPASLSVPAEVGGFIFTLIGSDNGNPDAAGTYRVSWGTFATPPGGTNVATLNGLAPTASFNSIVLSMQSTLTGSSLQFSNLSFTGTGLTIADGSFINGSASPSGVSPATANGQRLLADVDLRQFAWTLSGNLLANRGAGSEEAVRFAIGVQNAAFTLVPEPGSLALVGLVLIVLGTVTRRW